MFIVEKIMRAIILLGPHYDYWDDDSPIGETIHSLIHFVEYQPSILDDQYLGFRNWDWSRLTDEGGYFRKPRIKTEAYVTSKDNMVLEWYPLAWERVSSAVSIDNPEEQRRMDNRRKFIEDEMRGDFFSFSELAPHFGRPDNRLLHLSGPWHLNLRARPTKREDPLFEVSQILMKAVHRAYAHLYSLLETQFDLTKVRDLYLKDTKEGLKFVFLNVEEEEKRVWIRETFTKHGISPQILMETFQRAGYKYATTAKILAKEHSVRFTTDKIKKILKRLEEKHHTLYEKYFLKHSEKKEGQVIPFRKNNGS